MSTFVLFRDSAVPALFAIAGSVPVGINSYLVVSYVLGFRASYAFFYRGVSTGSGVTSETIDELHPVEPQGTSGSTVLDGRSADYALRIQHDVSRQPPKDSTGVGATRSVRRCR
jgi:hypothetical protein